MDYSAAIRQAEALFSDGQIDQAEAIFDNIIKQQPDNYSVLNNLGVIQHHKGNRSNAEKFFLAAVNAKTDYIDGCLNLAQFYIEEKKIAEACYYLEKCIQKRPNENIFKVLYQLHAELGNDQKAQAYLNKSIPSKFTTSDGIKSSYPQKNKYGQSQIRTKIEPLSILFVQDAPCIRNYKMATALRSRGHKVSLAYTVKLLSERYRGLSDDTYDENIQITTYRHLWEITKNYDLVHCHNEPDILTVAALAGDAPVIHDTHDLISLRDTHDPNISYFEGIANRAATGRVYSTPYQRDEAKALYGVDGPSLIFYNYASEADLSDVRLPKLSHQDDEVHIVYEGGVGGSAHRDFADLFIQLANNNIHIHIYPASFSQKHEQVFSKFPRIHYYQPVSPKQIIEKMTPYDFGIIPFNIQNGNKRFLDSTIANKLFEYLAAGLPVLTSDLRSYKDYFAKNAVGLTFRNAEEIVGHVPKLRKMATNIDWTSSFHTYEDKIGSLETFYQEVLSNKSQSEKSYVARQMKNTSAEAKDEQEVIPEADKARDYWKNHEVTTHYFSEGKQSEIVVKTIKQLMSSNEIRSVLEFGCNVGRNLHCIRNKFPGLDMQGIDINEAAIKAGRQHFKLPLYPGGEETLFGIPTNRYDIVFTVSVLDHIPKVEQVLKELLRISHQYFICIEPWNGENMDARMHAARDYSYFWDYPTLFKKMEAKILQDISCPLSNQGLGPYYRLYVIKPKEKTNARFIGISAGTAESVSQNKKGEQKTISECRNLEPDRIFWIPPEKIRWVAENAFSIYEDKGKVINGDWDLHINEFEKRVDFFRSFVSVKTGNSSWEQTPYYMRVMRDIDNGKTKWNCMNKQQLIERCRRLEDIYEDIRLNGYDQSKASDQVAVNIGRDGKIILNNGRHRLTFAKLLNLKEIPVTVTVRHKGWIDFRNEILDYAESHNSRVYAPLCHPDLEEIPSVHKGRFEHIRDHISADSTTVLDIGTHWGYMCSRIESELGKKCFAIEINDSDYYFLEKLRVAYGQKYHTIKKDIFKFVNSHRKFDTVLALAIFHHFIKNYQLHEALRHMLRNLDMQEMIFQAHKTSEPQMKNAFRNYSPYEFVDFIVQNSNLDCWEEIADFSGRKLFKIFKK
jgi:2-polyprenyl-3-methyl-5-hydroxy-6-metoxy-1,4-benzoquinol methylase/tetratricopeptide (TPR) repeat protein